MKLKLCSTQRGDISLLDLLAIIAAVVIVGMVGYAYLQGSHSNAAARRVNCVNQLKCIGLSFRLWANDNNDTMPARVSVTNDGAMEWVANGSVAAIFKVMSNEVGSPKILLCPADVGRQPATNFGTVADTNISFFAVPEADEAMPGLWLTGDRNLATNLAPQGAGSFTMPGNGAVSWTAAMHRNKGNVGLADGSAFQFNNAKLQTSATNALRDYHAGTSNATFRLFIP